MTMNPTYLVEYKDISCMSEKAEILLAGKGNENLINYFIVYNDDGRQTSIMHVHM